MSTPLPPPAPSPAPGLPPPADRAGPTLTRRRLHPVSPVLDLVVIAWRFWPVLIVALVNQWRLVALAPLLVVVLGWRFLAWERTSYELVDGTLRVERGVLNRTVRVVPADRVQQVEVVRKLRHQLFGVAMVDIELAGGGSEPKVSLDVLSVAEAQRLQAALAQARRGADRTGALVAGQPLPPPTPPDTTVVALPPALLALGGITGSGIVVVPIALSWALDVANDLRVEAGDVLPDAGPNSTVAVIGAVAAAMVVWLGVAAAFGVVRHYGFVLVQRPTGDLRTTRGLLERRSSTVPLARVQAVSVRANLVRRAIGLARVVVHTAAPARSDGPNDIHPGVPVLRRGDLDRVLGAYLPGVSGTPAWTAHPPAARRRAVVRRVAAAVVVTPLAVPVVTSGWAIAAVGALAVVLGVGWGRAAARQLAHAVDTGPVPGRSPVVHARRGLLAWRWQLVPVAKVQSVRLTSTPFQRRAGLVTVHLDIAGGEVRIPDVGPDRATELARLALGPAG